MHWQAASTLSLASGWRYRSHPAYLPQCFKPTLRLLCLMQLLCLSQHFAGPWVLLPQGSPVTLTIELKLSSFPLGLDIQVTADM